ncbi:MAG: nucleotidyltransferase family protein, partial [Candidatus Diapherotrites archaeon]|nr:nucleotidyltransferase family protein [Candidatus Diapherotrites archaeon]
MNAVILAAGKGTRLKPLTDFVPKCMVELKGKPLIEWILTELKKAGIKKAVLVVGYKKEKIKEFIGEKFKGIEIEYVFQKKQLGTGNALSTGEKKIN